MSTLHLIHSEAGLSQALTVLSSGDFVIILDADLIDRMDAFHNLNWAFLELETTQRGSKPHRSSITIDDMVTLSTQYKPILTWR
jgi:hypothetical protein